MPTTQRKFNSHIYILLYFHQKIRASTAQKSQNFRRQKLIPTHLYQTKDDQNITFSIGFKHFYQ